MTLGCGKMLSRMNKTGYCKSCSSKRNLSSVDHVQCGNSTYLTLLNGLTPLEYHMKNTFIKKNKRPSNGSQLKDIMLRVGLIKERSCSECGWMRTNPYTGRIPTELDHIDGDPTNNLPENLRILCPNCHSLTATHRGANVKRDKVIEG